MLLELNHIVKYVGDRCLFRVDTLKINSGEKIGLIGCNGTGKSTLLGIMAGTVRPDEGYVKRNGTVSFVPQMEFAAPMDRIIDPSVARQFAVAGNYTDFMSGGEKTRYKIASALSEPAALLLADEPSANLDIGGTELIQNKLQSFFGALVIVSHDRQLLDTVCNVIWEIEAGRVKIYSGNYTHFLIQKRADRKRQEREYESYIRDKRDLETAILDRKARSTSTRQVPKRMGNSEARLHKMGNQKARASLDNAVKAMESRLGKLVVKEKPQYNRPATFDLVNTNEFHSKEVVRGIGIHKEFERRTVFHEADFLLLSGQKVALIGPNGCGKTTLLKMILARDEQIFVSPKAKIGYFAQEMDKLDLSCSILDNVMTTSACSEGQVRLLLARLLFRREDVFKSVGVLSGGERTRVSLAKIIAGDFNVLFLDEPTNFLDLPSLEALEDVLADYQGTLLFVSHDRQFIDKVATHLMRIESGKLQYFQGNYHQYLTARQEQTSTVSDNKMVLGYRLSEILSQLSVAKDKKETAKLEQEYREILPLIKKLH